MPYNFNGQDVDINNITLQHLMDGIIGTPGPADAIGIGTTSKLMTFGSGGDTRMNLLRYGMNSLDTFFGSKYTDEYNSIIANISADTKTRFEGLGGNLSGLSTEGIGITTNLTGCIGTAINTWTPTVKDMGTYVGIGTWYNQTGITTSSNYTPYYLTRWGADATDSMLYAQLNFMHHVKFNSNGGATVANNVGISSANAINLPISERLQVEWASTLNPYPVWKDLQNKGSQTTAEVEYIFRSMVSHTNHREDYNLFSGEPWSLSWFLIHGINDSNNVGIGTSSIDDTAASAYIDNATKDLVIQNKYNFNYTRDADIQHKLCTEAQAILGIGNSMGITNWWKTTPLSFASPHNLLEAASRTMKVAKSESIGATNLDALDYNYFETRISRKNLGIGNTFLFTQLVDKGWI